MPGEASSELVVEYLARLRPEAALEAAYLEAEAASSPAGDWGSESGAATDSLRVQSSRREPDPEPEPKFPSMTDEM